MGLVHKIFGTHSQHELKRIAPIADKVESYREEYGKLTDEQLKAKTKRGWQESAWYGALQSADYWWYYSSSGTYRRDAYR